MRSEQRWAEKQKIASLLSGLSSEDEDEVLGALQKIETVCGKLEATLQPGEDHARFMLDVIELLVVALRERICPGEEPRLH